MIYQQRGGAGYGFFAFVSTLLFTLIGVVIGGFAGFALLLCKVVVSGVRQASFRARHSPSKPAVPVTDSEVQVSEKSEVSISEQTELPSDSTEWRLRFNDSFHRRHSVGKTVVDIWFYPKLGVALRSARIGNARIAKKIGTRIKLEEIKIGDKSVADVEQLTIAEVENILERASKPKESPVIASKKDVPPTGKPLSVPDNVRHETAPTSVQAPALSEPAVQAPLEQMPSKPRPPRKAEATYRGVLEKFGVESREDRNNGGHYNCFCLHLFDWSLGTSHDLVGTDLERAIREANAAIGDSIEVSLVGDIKTPIGGGKVRRKKVWSIIKIDHKPQ